MIYAYDIFIYVYLCIYILLLLLLLKLKLKLYLTHFKCIITVNFKRFAFFREFLGHIKRIKPSRRKIIKIISTKSEFILFSYNF